MNSSSAIKAAKTFETAVKIWIPLTGIKKRTGNLFNSVKVTPKLVGDKLTLSLSTIFYGYFLENGTSRGIKPYRFAYNAAKTTELKEEIKAGAKQSIDFMFRTKFPRDKAPKGFVIK